MTFSYRHYLLLILTLGLLVRLVMAVLYPYPVANNDAADYHGVALSLINGQGYSANGAPLTSRPPLYPLFVAGIYSIFGAHPAVVMVFQAIIDTATLAIAAWWVRRRLSDQAALWTVFFGATSVSLICQARALLTECLATFFLVVVVVLFDTNRLQWRRLWITGAIGLLCGLMVLTRSIMILLPMVLALYLLLDRANPALRWKGSLLLLTAYVLTLTPWLYRNAQIVGRPTFSTITGRFLYTSHMAHPGMVYGNWALNETDLAGLKVPKNQQDAYYVRETLKSLRTNWPQALAFLPKKFMYFMAPFDWELMGGGRRINFSYLAILLFACAGAWQLRRTNPNFLVNCMIPFLYTVAICLIFLGSPRYRGPVEIMLYPLAAVGIMALVARIMQPNRTTQAVSVTG